jgi:hypothetical protein
VTLDESAFAHDGIPRARTFPMGAVPQDSSATK